MMEFLLLLVLAIPILLFLIQSYRKKGRIITLPPGPPGLPLIGNLHQLDNSALYRQLCQLSKTYGPLMSLQLGALPALVVSSSKMAKEVLKTNDAQFASRPSLISFQQLSYNGLNLAFAPYNDYWREMRKICVLHLFSSKRVQSFRSIREDEVSRIMEKIHKFSSESKLTNLSETLLSFANNIISRIAFGRRYDEESCGRSKFQDLLSESQAVAGGFFFSDYFPYIGWLDKLTGQLARLQKNCKEFNVFLDEVISEHRDEKRAKSAQEDIIDVLLQLQKDGSSTIQITSDHIKAVLKDIFAAGTDTTAATLVWATTELIKKPEAMKRLQEEVRNVAGNRGVVDESDLEKLPYLKAVLKETLRLHPPAPLLIPHETIEQCKIDGYEIRPKTLVYVNAWAIGRDPESWENPEEFMPERFLGSSIDFRGNDFELIPFGAGRRGCPGIHLGVVTVELALANFLYSFNWELPAGMKKEDIDIDVKPGITMHKKNPLCLLARKYSGHLDE